MEATRKNDFLTENSREKNESLYLSCFLNGNPFKPRNQTTSSFSDHLFSQLATGVFTEWKIIRIWIIQYLSIPGLAVQTQALNNSVVVWL